MKKAFGWSVLIIASVCLVFLAGLFTGRNTNSASTFATVGRTIIYLTEPADSPVNLNTADAETLETLPGIGTVLAQRIIEHRTELGGFTSIQQLLDVEGIGNKTVENIIEYICLED